MPNPSELARQEEATTMNEQEIEDFRWDLAHMFFQCGDRPAVDFDYCFRVQSGGYRLLAEVEKLRAALYRIADEPLDEYDIRKIAAKAVGITE